MFPSKLEEKGFPIYIWHTANLPIKYGDRVNIFSLKTPKIYFPLNLFLRESPEDRLHQNEMKPWKKRNRKQVSQHGKDVDKTPNGGEERSHMQTFTGVEVNQSNWSTVTPEKNVLNSIIIFLFCSSTGFMSWWNLEDVVHQNKGENQKGEDMRTRKQGSPLGEKER